MKALGRKLFSVCMGLFLLGGCMSFAWADEAERDVSQMEILVVHSPYTKTAKFEYDGNPIEPVIAVVPMLSREQLDMMEFPSDTQSIQIYEYDTVDAEGESAHAIELVSYDARDTCLAVNMFARFDSSGPAEAFLERIREDFGEDFLKGSTEDGVTYAQVNMIASSPARNLSKRGYEKALRDALIDYTKGPIEGEDYTVAYANNDVPGMATATIEGMGDYHGTQTVEFTIADDIPVSSHAKAASTKNASNASAILGYVVLVFLVAAVAIVLLVFWRSSKGALEEDPSEEKIE